VQSYTKIIFFVKQIMAFYTIRSVLDTTCCFTDRVEGPYCKESFSKSWSSQSLSGTIFRQKNQVHDADSAILLYNSLVIYPIALSSLCCSLSSISVRLPSYSPKQNLHSYTNCDMPAYKIMRSEKDISFHSISA
jgi:hypothetical protein